MNIIINGFHHLEQIDLVAKIVDNFKVKYLLHICDTKYLYQPGNEEFHLEKLPFHIAGVGEYPDEDYEPLDEVLIEKMAVYETVVLKMIDRLEYYSKRYYSYQQRKDLYLLHLKYWHTKIIKNKIDLYIGSNIPHEVYDYVIYGLLHVYNIPAYFFLQSQINNLIHPMINWEKNTESIPFEYERLLKQGSISRYDDIVEYEWSFHKNNNIPFYMKSVSIFQKVQSIFNINKTKKYLHPTYYSKQFFLDIRRNFNNLRLHSAYKKISVKPDYGKPYVYVALHYQPEMTTCPIGGAYVEQSLIIEMLDKYLPQEINIYIKEHPKQENVSRGTNYYSQILKNKKRVSFVSLETKSFDLIKNSIAVATISGTAGWEALFRNKPVLLFGHNFYQYAPGVFMIKSNLDCEMAVKKILASHVMINENDLKLFIQAVKNCSIKGVIDPAYETISEIGIEESNDNIINWLKENLSIK